MKKSFTTSLMAAAVAAAYLYATPASAQTPEAIKYYTNVVPEVSLSAPPAVTTTPTTTAAPAPKPAPVVDPLETNWSINYFTQGPGGLNKADGTSAGTIEDLWLSLTCDPAGVLNSVDSKYDHMCYIDGTTIAAVVKHDTTILNAQGVTGIEINFRIDAPAVPFVSRAMQLLISTPAYINSSGYSTWGGTMVKQMELVSYGNYARVGTMTPDMYGYATSYSCSGCGKGIPSTSKSQQRPTDASGTTANVVNDLIKFFGQTRKPVPATAP